MAKLSFLRPKKARTFVNKFTRGLGRSALQITARLQPERAAAWAETLFLTPQRYRPPQRETQLLARASQSSLQVGDDLLRVWRWGSGPDLLLMHGWAGRGGQFGAWVDILVEAGFRVTMLDAPAHGGSSGRTSSLYQFVLSLEEAERQLGPFEAVIGHSMGGAASLIAAARGLSLKRLVTIGSPASVQAVLHRAFHDKMGLSEQMGQRIQSRIEARFEIRMQDLDPLTCVKTLSQPLLVIHDLDDGEIPWAEAEALASAAPNGELLTTKGLGHVRILRKPEVILKVRDFLLGENPQPLTSPEMAWMLGERQ